MAPPPRENYTYGPPPLKFSALVILAIFPEKRKIIYCPQFDLQRLQGVKHNSLFRKNEKSLYCPELATLTRCKSQLIEVA